MTNTILEGRRDKSGRRRKKKKTNGVALSLLYYNATS
jgi:hypothetical protein